MPNFDSMFFFLRLIMFCFVRFGCYLLETGSFLKKDRKGVVLEWRGGREELGGVEGGETIIMIYYNVKNVS